MEIFLIIIMFALMVLIFYGMNEEKHVLVIVCLIGLIGTVLFYLKDEIKIENGTIFVSTTLNHKKD